MSIITLITDYGLKDHFVGILKGNLITYAPNAQIIDVSHLVDKFNVLEASYLLENSYHHFPEGSIHIICVDAVENADSKHIVVLYNGHYFVGTNNGIIGNLAKNNATLIVEIDSNGIFNNNSDTEIFAKVATHIANGGTLTEIGTNISTIKKLNIITPTIDANLNSIKGCIVYIDDFGNCVSNISKSLFESVVNEREYEIKFSSYRIKKIKKNYSDFKTNTASALKQLEGTEMAVFNEANWLEIAIYRSNVSSTGTANSLLGIKILDTITIEFKN